MSCINCRGDHILVYRIKGGGFCSAACCREHHTGERWPQPIEWPE